MRRVVSVFCFAALSVAFAAGAATARECKNAAVTATGEPAATQLVAYPSSLFAWRRAVREAHGPEWNSWRYAQDRDIKCDREDGQWVCKRSARPCQDTLSTVGEQVKEAIANKDCKDDSLSSYGRSERKEDKAQEQAIWGWKIDAKRKYGSEWDDWDLAKDQDIDCRKRGSRFQCIAVGTACKPK